jgi:hypothetical protein
MQSALQPSFLLEFDFKFFEEVGVPAFAGETRLKAELQHILIQNRQYVFFAHEKNVLAFGATAEFIASPRGEQYLVTLFNLQAFTAAVFKDFSRTDRQHRAALRFVFGAIRQHDPAGTHLFRLFTPHHKPIAERLYVHLSLSLRVDLVSSSLSQAAASFMPWAEQDRNFISFNRLHQFVGN